MNSNEHYAVIFTSQRNTSDNDGYEKMAEAMVALAKEQKGFLGIESSRDNNGFGITVSYWDSLENIKNWKNNESHTMAQSKGKDLWYSSYKVRICKVEREY